MEASISCSPIVMFRSSTDLSRIGVIVNPNSHPTPISRKGRNLLTGTRKFTARIRAIHYASVAADPAQVEITWQILVGSLAGVTPFVVAGVEFGKRIMAQRRCGICGGSGLVLREKKYFRCTACGGFLPWQSWKKFFSG